VGSKGANDLRTAMGYSASRSYPATHGTFNASVCGADGGKTPGMGPQAHWPTDIFHDEDEEQKKVRKVRVRHILCMYFMLLQTTKATGVSFFSASMDSYTKLKQMKIPP